jgi:hypothetical protein
MQAVCYWAANQTGIYIYEGRPESKDRLAIKKNKENKKKILMCHYYRL